MKKYTEFSVKILTRDVLTEVRRIAREEVDSNTRYLQERLSESNKALQVAQKDIATLKTKCNRLESQINN